MHAFKRLTLALCTGLLSTLVGAQEVQRVGDFTLIDHLGDSHQLSRYGYLDAVVIVSQATGCVANQEHVARYKVLRTNFDHRKVGFLMLNANPADTRETVRAEEAVWNYDFPILLDDTQLVAEALGLTAAGQVVVVEPNRGTVLYRGPLETNQRRAEVFNLLEQVVTDGVDPRTAPLQEVA